MLKYAKNTVTNILGLYQLNSFTNREARGIGENQDDMVFIASTIGKEMDYVQILSSEHVKFQ